MKIIFSKKNAGFTLLEVTIGMGIAAFAALIGVYFFSDIQSYFSSSKNEAQLTDARTLIPVIFDSEKICTENLKGYEKGHSLESLTINKTKVFEMQKTLDLTASKDFSEKYSMNNVVLQEFIPFGDPFLMDHEGVETRVIQGFLDLGIHYSRYVKGNEGNIRNISENYNVLVLVEESSNKILSCISSFLSSPNDFCTRGLRGTIDPTTGVCHNLKLSTHHKDEPAVTLDSYLSAGEKKSLKMFDDGMLIGDFPNVISIGGKLSRYTEIVKYVADKESYNPDGSVKEVLERDQVYYRASYKANPVGTYPPYTYKVEEKRNKTKKPNSPSHKTEVWTPAEVKPHLKEELGDGNAWSWEKWAKAEMNDYDEKNWFYKIYGKTPHYNSSSNMVPHPLRDGVPAHQVVEQLFNAEGGVVLANNVQSRLKQNDEEINSNQTFESGYYAYFSDRNLKENIQPISQPEKVLNLKGKHYQFKETPLKKDFGFLADEVEREFPHAVSTETNNYQSVDYYSLLSPLIEMVKKQDKKIQELKKQIEEIE